MSNETSRVEAAAAKFGDLMGGGPRVPLDFGYSGQILAAADADDHANGIRRVRVDEQSIAEVLAGALYRLGFDSGQEDIEEVAAALAAAGIGPVQEAKAQAWDELCTKMSDDLTDAAPGYGEDMRQVNPYRKDQTRDPELLGGITREDES